MQGDFDMALRMAKHFELILDLREALDLTILGARSRKPIFDPMAVRWIKVVDDAGRLKLAEVRRLAQMFEAVRRGDEAAARNLEHFLGRGRF